MITLNGNKFNEYFNNIINDAKNRPEEYLEAFRKYEKDELISSKSMFLCTQLDGEVFIYDQGYPDGFYLMDQRDYNEIKDEVTTIEKVIELIQEAMSELSEYLIKTDESLLNITSGMLSASAFDPKDILVVNSESLFYFNRRHNAFNIKLLNDYSEQYGIDYAYLIFLTASDQVFDFTNYVSLENFMKLKSIVSESITKQRQIENHKLSKHDPDYNEEENFNSDFNSIFESIFNNGYKKYFEIFSEEQLSEFRQEFELLDESQFNKNVYKRVKFELYKKSTQ